MTTAQRGLSPANRTSLPSHSLKVTGAWIRPKTSRRMAAARAGVGLGRNRAIMGPSGPFLAGRSPVVKGQPAEQGVEKGQEARRRPKAAGGAYSLYVEPAAEGVN